MSLGDVVDELLNHDRLADAGAAEQADLPALDERRDEIDDLDAGLENLGLGLQLGELRGGPVDGPPLDVGRNRRPAVDRFTQYVQDAPQRSLAHRGSDGSPGVAHLHPTGDAVGGAHGHGADLVLPDVLLDLGRQLDRDRPAGILDRRWRCRSRADAPARTRRRAPGR